MAKKSKKEESDPFAQHELLHTAYLMCQFFDVSVTEHSECQGKIKEKAEQIATDLANFYQFVANEVYKDDKNNCKSKQVTSLPGQINLFEDL